MDKIAKGLTSIQIKKITENYCRSSQTIGMAQIEFQKKTIVFFKKKKKALESHFWFWATSSAPWPRVHTFQNPEKLGGALHLIKMKIRLSHKKQVNY